MITDREARIRADARETVENGWNKNPPSYCTENEKTIWHQEYNEAMVESYRKHVGYPP